MLTIIVQHIIALTFARAGAGDDLAAIGNLLHDLGAAAMAEGFEIRFLYAAKTPGGMDDGAISRADAVMFDRAKNTDHNDSACGVNGMSALKGIVSHEANIVILL